MPCATRRTCSRRPTDEVEERRSTIARWVDEFGDRAYAFAVTLTTSEAEAQDLMQEAWLVVLEHRGRLPSDDMARGWVFEIVRRLGMNRQRLTSRREGLLEHFEADVPRPEQAAAPELDVEALVREVLRHVDELPELQQRVLVARLLEGRSVRDTAEHIGRAPGTVKGSLARAIATLRLRLGDEWEEALRRAPLRRRPPAEGGGRRGADPGQGHSAKRKRSDDEIQEDEA